MLNGFISGFEDFVHAPLRSKVTTTAAARHVSDAQRPADLPEFRRRRGRRRCLSGRESGAPRRRAPSRDTRVAARVAVNISGASEFTLGNFVGVGLSVDKKVLNWMALHGDVRGSMVMDRVSVWTCPSGAACSGFRSGPEFRLAQNTSLNLQLDGSTTPYQQTGSIGLDADYGDVAFGLSHRFTRGSHPVVAQFYARENMNMPFSVRWNADPDFAIGFKLTIH